MNFGDKVYRVPASARPCPLDRTMREQLPGVSWTSLRRMVRTGKVSVDGTLTTDPSWLVKPGAEIAICMSSPRASGPSALPADAIVYADAQIVVVQKPAGISSVPFENERGTLVELVRRALEKHGRKAPLGVVHRLDKETSGVLVFARGAASKRHLEGQFRAHSVYRRYLALAHGRVTSQIFRSRLVKDRGDGLRGSVRNPKIGRVAVTHVSALESLELATLIACRLETGRTHQIRIHLSEAGHPLLGEPVYARNYSGQIIKAPRLMLHAASLGFMHPVTGRELTFDTEVPADMRETLRTLSR